MNRSNVKQVLTSSPSSHTLCLRMQAGKERFCWGVPDEEEGVWKRVPVPVDLYLELNELLNTRFQFAATLVLSLYESGYEDGFADDALPPNGVFMY